MEEAPIPDQAGDAQARFEELQEKLVPLWKSMESFTEDEQTIVVVPAMASADTSAEMQAYEERFLFLLLLLRQPRARLVYVTSNPVPPSIVDYYFSLLPGVIPSHASRRFFNPSPMEWSNRSLTEKLLERPLLLDRIRALIPDPDRAHLVPYSTSVLERDLAVELGIPMYGSDPRHFDLGTKTGCRRIFAEEGVAHPMGHEDLRGIEEVARAVASMRAEREGLAQVIVKLNEGASGSGNALVDLAGLPPAGAAGEEEALVERIRGMAFEDPLMTLDAFESGLAEIGGVVEERIAGKEFRSPSVQMRITPLGELELLSTHDQLLGGPSGQAYLGATFPADADYAATIGREALKIGRRLIREGVLGRFAVDFVAVRGPDDSWDAYAIELNLRKGGTTHPFLTLQFLTDGTYDPGTGVYTAPSGRRKCFVASDHLQSESYRGLTPDDLFDIVARHNLHFDQARQTGVVFHMMSGLPELGQTGLTAVGDSHEEAREIYDRVVQVLDAEATGMFHPR